MQSRGSRAGASLVEVLVVLVILLIGVSAIVRVFPLGFQGLRAGENRTLASRLATQQMEQIKADQDNLMQGVLFRYHDGSSANSITVLDEDPDNLTGYDPDGANTDPDTDIKPSANPYWSDVNKYRFIEGERVKIPLPTPTGFGRGSVHVVKFGPIYIEPTILDPAQPYSDEKELQFLQVRGTPMRGISVNVDDFPGDSENNVSPADQAATRLRGAQTYLIDYNENSSDPPKVLFPRRDIPRNGDSSPATPRNPSNRVFVVSYAYDNGSGEPVSVTERITVEDSEFHVWQSLGHNNVFVGSDTVSRAFTRLPNTTGGWDGGDPYQYKLLSANIPSSSGTTPANFGILAFNPAGANYTDRTPYGEQPFSALIDYMVLDWHILREDRQVPQVLTSGGRIPIKLTLNYLKRFGDVEADQTTYKGLYNVATNSADDIQVFNLQTGQQLQGAFYDFSDTGATYDNDADFFVNTDERGGSYRTGTLYLNADKAGLGAGTQLRVLYKADGDWAVAVQKAYSRYERRIWQPSDTVPANRPDNYDNFIATGSAPGAERIYFRSSEINKSVVATLEYRLKSGKWTRTPPLHLTIDTLDGELDPATKKARYAYINLNPQGKIGKYMPDRDDSTDPSNVWRVFGNIVGSSLKVRVIWRDNASMTNTWRVQDLDTYLDRPRGILDILRR